MNNYSLKNDVVIITGGLGLLGKEFVKICLENDASVIIADIEPKEAFNHHFKTYDEKKLQYLQCDITNLESIKLLIDSGLKKFGKITALVNNAYPRNQNYGRKFEQVTFADFCENINLQLGGYFLITQQLVKSMKEQNYGNIINLASIYGFKAPRFDIYKNTNMTMPVEYAAVKGALLNLTLYLASYLGPYNIRVNAISPGGIFNNQSQSFVEEYSQYAKLGKRMASPNDIVGALLFLLSPYSKYITGQNIIVDGGWTL